MNKGIFAIGALGGSGTRAVAEIFKTMSCFIGDDLNPENDNLLFTRLFKNPIWYQNKTPESFRIRLECFIYIMSYNSFKDRHLSTLQEASITNQLYKSDEHFFTNINDFLSNPKQNRQFWGWKEPNTQIYVKDLLEAIGSLKYIHVLRHGLDMAYSRNKQQLKNWGFLFDIHLNDDDSEILIAQKQLQYWIETTRMILRLKESYPDRIYILNHSQLCFNPNEEIDRLLSFCDINLDEKVMNELYSIPQNKGSIGRYRNQDISVFNKSQLNFVQSCGFETI